MLDGAAGQAAILLDHAPQDSAPAGDASYALLHGLFWLAANLCTQRALLLCVDDVHWCDASSLRFLAHLLPRLDGLGLLVVVALRPGEADTAQHLLDQITTDPSATLLRPAPLSPAASAQVVRAIVTPSAQDEFCAACYTATGGNPLLLRELAVVAAAEGVPPTTQGTARLLEVGPQAVGRRVALRLARLGLDAAALAGAVAILGRDADPGPASALSGLPLQKAMQAAGDLAAGDILRPSLPLGFVHPLVRAAVYQGLSEVQRVEGHASAARLLTAAGAPLEHVAAHLLRVPPADDPDVVVALRRAAGEALRCGSPEVAVAYLERCLAEPPAAEERSEVLIRLGATAQLVDMAKSAEHLEAAFGLVQQPVQRAMIAELLAGSYFYLERYRDAVTLCAAAAEALGAEHVDQRQRLDVGLMIAAQADPELLGCAQQRVDELRDEPADASLGSKMLDCVIAGLSSWWGQPASQVVPRARRGLAGGMVLEQANGSVPFGSACHTLLAADLDEVMPVLDAAVAQAHRCGSIAALAGAKCFRALGWYWRGFLAEAEADARDLVHAVETARMTQGRPYAGAYLADPLMEQGRLDEAQAALDWACPADRIPPSGHWFVLIDSRARLLVMQGRAEEALEAALDQGRRVEAAAGRNPASGGWRSNAALALLALGRRSEARRFAAEEVALAQRWGAPRALGRALRVAGLVEGREEGLRLLREAVVVLQDSPARLENAKALVELGTALCRAGQRIQSREHLRRAVELAQLCGATPLVERGRAELRASGARPRRVALSGPDALTPSELRVAELAAAGQTNRYIAQALFVTTKTVEVHLSSVYRKLDVSGRANLAKVLPVPAGT